MKEIIIVAGPNGSGKSTLAGQLDLKRFINADMYEKKFFSHIENKEYREKRVAVAVANEIKECLKQGDSFAFETVFSAERIPQFLQRAKSQGYVINLHFVATEKPEINVLRVAKRVAEGGHDVPEQKILDRYVKSLLILPELLKFSDKAILYDNSRQTLRPFLVKEENQIKIFSEVPDWAQSLS